MAPSHLPLNLHRSLAIALLGLFLPLASCDLYRPYPNKLHFEPSNETAVRGAALFASEQLLPGSKMGTVTSARSRLAAGGRNFHLTLKLANGSFHQVIVNHHPRNGYRLVSDRRVPDASSVKL